MNKTNTKRALFLSLVSLLLCFSMMLGTTFAWFTDSVNVADNRIVAGNLDVELNYKNASTNGTYADVEEFTGESFFVDENGEKILWEPGVVSYTNFKVVNEGSLALKYTLKTVADEFNTVNNGANSLKDVIKVGVITEEKTFADRDDAVKAVTSWQSFEAFSKEDAVLLPGAENAFTVVLYWAPNADEVDNIYNLNNGKKADDGDDELYINVDITLVATQYTHEEDSFDNQYDNDATYPELETADVWDGTADTSWYNDTDIEFGIVSAEQLAGFADLVDAGNTFEGKTIKLINNIDLYSEDANGDRVSFDPIGYGYNTVFKGTFDGQGKTISNLYQNGWALGLDYSTEGGGLFASVVDATIKDLTIDNAEIVMECIDMGVLVGYSYGNCIYENITVSNSTIANYNRYTGGVVGEVNGTQTFKNVDVINTVVSALWGTYDAACGGIVGGKWGEANLTFEDCDVSAQLDVFNDACSNYQYYNYRLSGMLIGMSEEVTNGVATASYLTAKNCTVTYGDWVNYTYCESESYGKGSYAAAGEWKYKRVQEGYATDGVDPNHTHDTDESHEELFVFDQLFGGDKGVQGGKTHTGVTVIYPNN